MVLGELIKKRRKELGLSAERIAELCDVNPATVYRWENGSITNIPSVKIALLSNALKVSPSEIVGTVQEEDMYQRIGIGYIRIPLYPNICCGNGGFVDDDIEEYVPIPSRELDENKEYFCQTAIGDSMTGVGIDEGDLLAFEKTSDIQTGKIGCFCIDENFATCKKYTVQNGMIILMPANAKYDPIVVDPLNVHFRCVGILKKVVKNF